MLPATVTLPVALTPLESNVTVSLLFSVVITKLPLMF
jgi:hypothetical protein